MANQCLCYTAGVCHKAEARPNIANIYSPAKHGWDKAVGYWMVTQAWKRT